MQLGSEKFADELWQNRLPIATGLQVSVAAETSRGRDGHAC
jgi:hypothetical protein